MSIHPGYTVVLHAQNTDVEKAFDAAEFNWEGCEEQMRLVDRWTSDAFAGMLGQTHHVVAVKVGLNQIGLRSPDGSQDGVWWFPKEAFTLVTESGVRPGFTVVLHAENTDVEKAFDASGFEWAGCEEQMRLIDGWKSDSFASMLGQVHHVTAVKGAKVGVASPDGSQDGIWWFPVQAFTQITGRPVLRGFSVILPEENTAVERAFDASDFDWTGCEEQMRLVDGWTSDSFAGMLGKAHTVIAVRGDNVGIASPDGSQDGVWWFPRQAFTQVLGYSSGGDPGLGKPPGY